MSKVVTYAGAPVTFERDGLEEFFVTAINTAAKYITNKNMLYHSIEDMRTDNPVAVSKPHHVVRVTVEVIDG